jgi:hypothetical protein
MLLLATMRATSGARSIHIKIAPQCRHKIEDRLLQHIDSTSFLQPKSSILSSSTDLASWACRLASGGMRSSTSVSRGQGQPNF